MVIIAAHVEKQVTTSELTVTIHDKHDVKTCMAGWMQQDLKRERPGAPPPVGKSLQAQQDK
jgi:hypothetical protein